jgi:hypothetical protein
MVAFTGALPDPARMFKMSPRLPHQMGRTVDFAHKASSTDIRDTHRSLLLVSAGTLVGLLVADAVSQVRKAYNESRRAYNESMKLGLDLASIRVTETQPLNQHHIHRPCFSSGLPPDVPRCNPDGTYSGSGLLEGNYAR